jgi:hypothetical protein
MEEQKTKRLYEAMLDGSDGNVVRATFPAESSADAIDIIRAIYMLTVSPLPRLHACSCRPAGEHRSAALRAVK